MIPRFGFLAFLATAFALSADLFTMFFFFELMGGCAFVPTGYRVDQPGPLQAGQQPGHGSTRHFGGFSQC